jgi:DNA invertase Pin-like site-specific DNA recombinase
MPAPGAKTGHFVLAYVRSSEIQKDGRVSYRIERPKFQELVKLLVQKKYQGVICLCWDRISRNPQDDAIIKNFINQGVDIRFVQANYDKSSAGALHMDIDSMFAAHYSRICSEKIRAANSKLRNEGKTTNRSPIGYFDDGSDHKPLDPERAPIIKKLFEMYVSGEWSMAQLAKWAAKQGLISKGSRPRRTKKEILLGTVHGKKVCRPLTIKSIEKILHNPFYAGFIRYMGELMPGQHKPIISKELFFQVHDLFTSRNFHPTHRIDKPLFVYQGLVTCSCGRRYSPYKKKGHSYYSSNCLADCGNSKRTISGDQLDDLFIDTLDRIALSEEEKAQLEKAIIKELIHAPQIVEEKRLAIENKLAKLRRDLEYMQKNKLTLIREAVYTPQEYSWEMEELRRRLQNINQQKSELSDSDYPKMLSGLFNFTELVKTAKNSYKLFPEAKKKEVFLSFITELKIADGKNPKAAVISAKEGCEKLLKRRCFSDGAASFIKNDLPFIYAYIKNDFPNLKT